MITAFARDFSGGGSPPALAQSVYFDDGGLQQGDSYLSGVFDYGLQLPGDGYTLSSWIKPDWASGPGGAPVHFMKVQTNGDDIDTIWMGYDSETLENALFIHTNIYSDFTLIDTWFFAPLVDDPYNQSITGMSGALNSWNATTTPGFVNVAAVISDVGTSTPSNQGDLSDRCKIFWNGQLLNVYEYWAGSNQNWHLNGFRAWAVQVDVGCVDGWTRKHWQDRTALYGDTAPDAAIMSDYYGNGTPQDPVPQSTLHYNYENPSPWDSNGTLSYTLTPTSVSPASDPITDPTQGVA